MKTYQSGTNDRRRSFFARHKYAVVVAGTAIVIAVAITLAIVLSSPKSEPAGIVVDPPAADVDAKPSIVLPMASATTGMGYADDKLVRWDTLEMWKWHPAVDFVGSGNVVSIMDGKVTGVEKTTLDGNVVTVTHADGYVSVYKSLGSDIAVEVGRTVKAGDKLGTSSKSMMSELKTGDHLHFELKKNGKYVDPATILPIGDDK